MRMFWACTHTMLRITEIPLFSDLGIEIIPTEVTPSVMTYLEGVKYDASDIPINQFWRSRNTLPENVLTILTRSRLWERDGNITEAEATLFNQYIDVMYVPTRLELAINIAKWFKGAIIYRYFGDLLEGKRYLKNIPQSDYSAIRKMIFLPIFRSLLTAPVARYFDQHIVLHNYLDTATVPTAWQGFKKDAEALIVLGSVHNYRPFQQVLRSIIPLAKKIPIKLLGKNIYSMLPKDIRDAFIVKTDLERHVFFDEFFSSQFLIYPHARRDHSHNVPIEAIYGKMPIIFRTNTPTFIENDHSRNTHLFPHLIGATRTTYGLRHLALSVYNNEEKLKNLISAQSNLIEPYSFENVRQEGLRLKEYLQATLPERKDPTQTTSVHLSDYPLAHYPASTVFSHKKNVIEDGFTAPIYQLIADNLLNQVKIVKLSATQQVTALRLTSPLQLIFGLIPGAESIYFSENTLHHLQVTGFSQGEIGACEITLEIYVRDRPVKRDVKWHLLQASDKPHPFAVDFVFSWHEPFHVVLYIKPTENNNKIYVDNLSHYIISETQAETLKKSSSRWIYANQLNNKTLFAMPVKPRSKRLQLIAPEETLINGDTTFNFALKLSSKQTIQTIATIEYWEGDNILHRDTLQISSPCDAKLSHNLSIEKNVHVKPVIYLHPAKQDTFYFESIHFLT